VAGIEPANGCGKPRPEGDQFAGWYRWSAGKPRSSGSRCGHSSYHAGGGVRGCFAAVHFESI